MNFGTETIIGIATVMNTNRSIRRLSLKNPRLFSRAEETTTHLAKNSPRKLLHRRRILTSTWSASSQRRYSAVPASS